MASVPHVVILRHDGLEDRPAVRLQELGVSAAVVNVSRSQNAWILDRVTVGAKGH